jgi:sulfite reductase alpha subunit-like flavoprotein
LPTGEQVIPDDVPLPPKWRLYFLHPSDTQKMNPSNIRVDGTHHDDAPIRDSILATVQSNCRITPDTHTQDTRHLTLTIPGHHDYLAGSTITIYPKNHVSNVEKFIELMSWTEIADQPLKFVSTTSSSEDEPPIPHLSTYTLTLRKLLTNNIDIMAIPRKSFFNHILPYASDEQQGEKCREFTSPEFVDDLYDYTTRPRRSILEVLKDFWSVKLPWQTVFEILPIIRGRKFSIASGGALKFTTPSESTRVELLIAIVKYRTIIRSIRHGLASRYISTLQPGQAIPIFLQPASALGVVPGDVSKPVVMVAPGTGVAPMRALTYDRKLWRQGEEHGNQDILFFGCRRKGVDEYFSTEWKDLGIVVHTAYSQDQVSFSLSL